METRKLYRSRSDSMLSGVCGGLAKFTGLDSTIIRLVFVLLLIMGGHGLLIYLILWLVMPMEPQGVVDVPFHPAAAPSPDVVDASTVEPQKEE